MADYQKNKNSDKKIAMPLSGSRRIWVFAGGILIIITALAYLIFRLHQPAAPAISSPGKPVIKMENAGQEKLGGRWLRSDGEYTIEIRGAAPDGKLDVKYFNPGPIHVAKADWQLKNGKLIVFIELRDVNYPGSTYTLEYLEAEDRLAGIYYQAMEQVNYDVEFEREK
jgi:hypothetical protein